MEKNSGNGIRSDYSGIMLAVEKKRTPFKVVVLAAGFGKRINPVWKRSKGLIPFRGETIIWHLIKGLENIPPEHKISVLIITNARHYGDYQDWLAAHKFAVPVNLIKNSAQTPAAARGAIRDWQSAIDYLGRDQDLLILPCDTIITGALEIEDFVGFARRRPGRISIVVRRLNRDKIALRFGNLQVDSAGKVIKFIEKPLKPISGIASTPIYFFPSSALGLIGEYLQEGNNPESPGMLIPWLVERKAPIYAYEARGETVDVGTPGDFAALRRLPPAERNL